MANNQGYVPRRDADFDQWQINLRTIVSANLVAWGIPATENSALNPLQNAWNSAYAVAKNRTQRTSEEVQAKSDARDAYEAALRLFIQRFLAINPAVSDSDREAMDITVRDTERTRPPEPQQAPKVTIESVTQKRHKLRIVDPLNPESKQKPEGVVQVQLYRFIGETAPVDVEEYEFLSNVTRFLYTVKFTMADAGKRAFYIARYENSRGEVGPFSEPVSEHII